MRHRSCKTLLCALTALAVPGSAAAQAYPNRPVRLIVPFAAGGGTDTLARMIAQRLTDTLGQTVVTDNRPAVDGVVGSDIVAKAVPDGYTLLIVSSSHAINPALGKKLPYDTLRDFAPITHTATQQLLFVVHPTVPARSIREVIDLTKAKPDGLNYGSSSNAVALPMELFKAMAGVRIQHIPYKGSGPMLSDLLGGQIQMAIAGAVASLPHVKTGKLRGLAIGDSKRSEFAPDIPTIAESGVPGYHATIWTGMLAPARTPSAIIERLNRDAIAIVQAPEFRQRLAAMGADTVGSTPATWGRFIGEEIAKWARIAKIAGMKAE
jgi:tripartite-type tricarboxylate transporter receptor subunit TctC